MPVHKYIYGLYGGVVILLFEYLFTGSSTTFTSFLELQLAVIYFFALIQSFIKFGIFNCYSIFLLTTGLFNFMKIFLGWMIGDNYREAYSLIHINLPENVVQEMLILYGSFLIALHCTYLFFWEKWRVKFETEHRKIVIDTSLLKLGKQVMFIFSIFALWRCYVEIEYILKNGQLIYLEGSSGIPIPFLVRLFCIFFQVGYMMVLASLPPKNVFLKYSLFYLLTQLPYVMIGLRGVFVVVILFILWYLYTIYDYKISLKKILLPAATFIIFLQIVAITRVGEEVSHSIFMLLPLFLTSQSQSMYVLGLYIQYKDSIMAHNSPFILDTLIGWMTGADGQSLEVLDARSSLGHQLVYSLNPDYYLSGMSLGTTNIAELYEFGILGVIIGGILYAIFLARFALKVKYSRTWLLFSFFLFSSIALSPRAAYFPSLYSFIRILIVYFIIIIINKIIHGKPLRIKLFR